MDPNSPSFAPLETKLRSQYLSIDLGRVRNSFENLISQGAAFFSNPLDNANCMIATNEGGLRELELSPSDALKAFDLIKEGTHYLALHISVRERTKNLGITLIAEEYIYFVIDFSKRVIVLSISVRGLEKANEIEKLLTEGIELVTVQLPKQHEFIEPHLHAFLADYPSTERNVLLIMRFQDQPPFPDIVEAVRSTAQKEILVL